MEPEKLSKPNDKIIRRIVICVVVLSVGIVGMMGLASLKKPPVQVKQEGRYPLAAYLHLYRFP